MKRVSQGTAVVLIVIVYIAISSSARAAHATNFLDALYSEVTNRLANPGTNSVAENAALRASGNVLGHDTRTLAGDVRALAAASTVLNKRFEDDPTLTSLEENALAAYATEAHQQLDGAKVRVEGFTNAIPRRVIRQFIQATNALLNFDANTNDFPSRARALAQVLEKMRGPVARILDLHPNPPAQAPDIIATTSNIQLEAGQDPNKTIYYFHTTSNGGATRSLTYFCNNPPENSEANPGTWQYIKTGKATAILRCTPNSPQGLGVHDFNLTFETTTVGTFTGSNSAGQSIQGIFFID